MSAALYEIKDEYLQVMDALTDPEADIPLEAVLDTLEGFENQLQEKAVNVAKFMQNMQATAQAIKEAEQKMAKRRQAIENRISGIREYLKRNMEQSGITKIESPWFILSIKNNPGAVAITNEQAIPDHYKAEVVTTKLDKQRIKDVLKSGEKVPGAVLVNGTRLDIR